MRERDIEAHLVLAVKRIGGFCMKWECPGMRGVPDRICQFPSGKTIFVELKAPGKKPRPEQARMFDYMVKRGAEVIIIDTKTGVDQFIRDNHERT